MQKPVIIEVKPDEKFHEKINFSYNWNNKLNCNAFTTLRLANSIKYVKGYRYLITLDNEPIAFATIADIKRLTLSDINEFIARLDTGYSVDECRDIIIRMYKKTDFRIAKLNLILLVKEK